MQMTWDTKMDTELECLTQSKTSQDLEEFLSHHGVKGQKWGRRNAKPASQRKIKVADRKWADNVNSARGAFAVHNHVANQMNTEHIPRINSKEKYKNSQPLHHPGSEIHKAYVNEYDQAFENSTTKAVNAIYGKSPSGKYTVKNVPFKDKYSGKRIHHNVYIVSTATGNVASPPGPGQVARHDAMQEDPNLEFKLFDKNALFSNCTHSMNSMEQSIDFTIDFLEHHGVKGQKWGRRNKKVKAKSSGDHSTVDKIRQKPIHAMTNKQLQTVNNRLNLERKYASLTPSKFKNGKRKTEETLAMLGIAGGVPMAAKMYFKTSAGQKTIDVGRKALLAGSLRGAALMYKFK